MKNIFCILAFLVFATALIGQDSTTKNVYINTKDYNWVLQNAQDYNQLIDQLEFAARSEDSSIANQQKSRVKTTIYRLANILNHIGPSAINTFENPESLYQKHGDKATFEAGYNNNPDYTILKITAEQASKINTASQQINNLKQRLSPSNYAIHPDQEDTTANISLLKEIGSLFSSSFDILSKS